ncbi:MAG: hypothetical protein II968_01175 [Selenomonadaceae bacterium]|nr:hypothetical protein [Selenomonadaceae bacterium]MBQ4494357.1 hypothetical protein [Selenomonadaceae bacterium]MBQ6759075.1 hypothetical protein [Selenomonadaceae bacterium]
MNLKTLKARLEVYLEAERKILLGQSYKIGSRELTRANLSDVRAAIESISEQIDSMERPAGRIRPVVF